MLFSHPSGQVTVACLQAALFSAISTAVFLRLRFVIESSKSLQPDPAETSAQTLSTISQILLAMANAQPGSQLSFSPPEPPKFAVSTSAVWVNVLWFLSLSLSVGVSLVAMLGKDWARAYMAELTGQPYQQARKRQQRWDSLEEWRMPQVITFLPTLLHLALLLFAIGLTVNLWSVHLGAAIPVLVVTIAATGVYAVSTALPLIRNNCPYSTPLTPLLRVLMKYLRVEMALSYLTSTLTLWASRMSSSVSSGYRQVMSLIPQARASDLEAPNAELAEVHVPTTTRPEEQQIDEDTLMDGLTSRAIAWLLVNYEDTKSADIALQAIAGADARLPMESLVELDVEMMLYQRLLSCSATRQKTERKYLKSPNLLEPATLYGRALAAFELSRGERFCFSMEGALSAAILQCVIDQSLKQKSLSPNKAAFALASQARLGILYVDTERATWVASTVELLGRHCRDDLTLDDSALLTLLTAISYILGRSYSLNDSSLPSVLLQLLLVSRPGSFNEPIIDQIGALLMIVVYSRPTSTPIQSAGSLEREANHDNYQTHREQLLDAVNHGGSVATYSQGMVALGLLGLLSRSHIHSFSDSDLATLSKLLHGYYYRPDSLEIHGLVIEKPGYNSRYFVNTIKPRVEPGDDGSFTESELVRATHINVVNREFSETLPDFERLVALRLALVNLEPARTNALKKSCCNVLFLCSRSLDSDDQNTSDWDNSLLVQFPLLPALGLLESDDERILPYVMKTVWQITQLVGKSKMSAEDKNDALQPVLSYERFAKYRKADIDFTRTSELAESLGYAEVWLSRLENMQGEALRHVHHSWVLFDISPTLGKDLYASETDIDSRSIRGRAVALFRRCQSEQIAARGTPLWPHNPI
ncbi:hypothetical protein FRC07_004238 [Ceratobasidium sp. 392]|nr:hypothetical protein FRC07_004238 [Ceratobasidium sp. 392]